MSQQRAGKMLGYTNGSRLARIESAVDMTIPILIVRRAAVLYEVSADWLLGLSDDWTSTVTGRELSMYLLKEWERQRSLDMEAVARLHDEIVLVRRGVEDCVSMADLVRSALDRFVEANGDAFLDYPCGAPLVSAVSALVSESEKVKRTHQRHKERSGIGLTPLPL